MGISEKILILLKYVFYLALLSIILGPFVSVSIPLIDIRVYLTDMIVSLFICTWLFYPKRLGSYLTANKYLYFFIAFLIVGFISLLFSPFLDSFFNYFVSFLYIIRLVVYFNVFFIVKLLIDKKLISSEKTLKLLSLVGFVLAIVGWIQYFLYPDLRNLYYLGWDPHFKRIFATYFDPNLLGIVFILSFFSTLFSSWRKNTIKYLFLSMIFLALMFTYSRGSYLAFLVSVSAFFIYKKKTKYILILISIFIVFAYFLPRPFGEGVRLERLFSIKERLINYSYGINIFRDYPLFGTGLNAVRNVKQEYGYLNTGDYKNNSAFGFDSSLIFIAVTTGIFGLLSIFSFLFLIYKNSDDFVKVVLIAVFIHSFGVNSFFFPWVMFWLWISLALDKRLSRQENHVDS